MNKSPTIIRTITNHSDDPRISWDSLFATHRLSPLICPNQDIVTELAVIMRKRLLDGEPIGHAAYARAISVRIPFNVSSGHIAESSPLIYMCM